VISITPEMGFGGDDLYRAVGAWRWRQVGDEVTVDDGRVIDDMDADVVTVGSIDSVDDDSPDTEVSTDDVDDGGDGRQAAP
jgi:hypothetical protein